MNTVRLSGTTTITSPRVWAGPTSISSTSRPPTSSVRRPSNVRVGRRRLDAIEVERAEEAAEQVTDLTRRSGQPGQQCRRNLLHLGGGGGATTTISALATSWLP